MPTLAQDLTRLAAWRKTPGLPPDGVVELTNTTCPLVPGAPVLRFTLRDGVQADFDRGKSPSRERVQIQSDAIIGHGDVWSFAFARCVRSWSPYSGERWQIDAQEHGAAPVQPLWALETQAHAGQVRRRCNHNAGRNAPRYAPAAVVDRPAQVLDVWTWEEVVWRKTTGPDGWLEWWQDDTRVARFDGPTSTETARGPGAEGLANGWINLGIYRHADATGVAVMDVCGARISRGGRVGPPSAPGPAMHLVADDLDAVRATCLSIQSDAVALLERAHDIGRDAAAAATVLAAASATLHRK